MNQELLIEEDEKNVQDILNLQREESEAREIVRDVSNQYSLPPEKKGRWIWEILQNARDVAKQGTDGQKSVNIEISLQEDLLIVKHNGKPFTIGELIALFRRTSTKGITGQEGTTGKYGTGFVTTHVLNKIVQISGYIQNKTGLKKFDLEMNRSFDEIIDMQQELAKVFDRIENIRIHGEYVTPAEAFTEFRFKIGERSREIATNTMKELANNIVFTMLCNRSISSVKISNSILNEHQTISLAEPVPVGDTLNFYKSNSSLEAEEGILSYLSDSNFIIGLPVEFSAGAYKIRSIGYQARFYKELPLIGTELANLPFLIQSGSFRPPEPRDGLRIIKDAEDVPDKTADANREALSHLSPVLIQFFKECEKANIENLHLLAESGLPIDKAGYCKLEWYQENVQQPLREYFSSVNIVQTANKEKKQISQCCFVQYDGTENSELLYALASDLNPAKFPDADTWKDWSKIIYQESTSWPDGIVYDLEKLLSELNSFTTIDEFPLSTLEEKISWLNKLHMMLKNSGRLTIADVSPIYLSQSGKLCTKSSLKIDVVKNTDFKNYVAAFGHPIGDRLIHDDLQVTDGVENFPIEEFTGNFHTTIGILKPSELTNEQVNHLLKIISSFRNIKSPIRQELYDRLQEVLGVQIPPITQVDDMEFYKWDTPDDLATRYMCYLVEQADTLENLAQTYFEGNYAVTIAWLNKLYKFLGANEENRKIRENYKIFLVQSGSFNSWEFVVHEDSVRSFDKLIKDLHRDYVKTEDPYSFLLDHRIDKEGFKLISLKEIATPIDLLFAAEDAERKVKEGQPYNQLFHEVNNFVRDNIDRAHDLFPSFMRAQADLLLKAMGRAISRKVLIVQKMNRSEEELEKMATLKLPADQLKSLENAAMQVGTQKLLEKAQEIQEASEQSHWRKKVGTRAEEAFTEAIKGVQIELLEIQNPDEGCDYTLKITGKDHLPYQVEIKSTGYDKSTVKMSKLQGETASTSQDRYSLCVVNRDANDEVSVPDFIANARFVPQIGTLVKDKIDGINSGLLDIEKQEVGDVNVSLENKRYAVNVRQKVWTDNGIGFAAFVNELRKYLGLIQ